MGGSMKRQFWEGDENTPNLIGKAGEALREIAGHTPGYGYTKQALGEAARRTGLSQSRTFDLWYGKARRVEQYELDAINDALNKKRREVERNELHDLQLRIARLEARLASSDPEFHRPTLDALRGAKTQRG